jgi:Rad3-related DNA helicase
MDKIPSPAALGMPARYKHWRPNQEAAIHLIDSSVKSTVGMMLPPGAGKTGIYFGWALWRKKRIMVLAPSKMLQDQIYGDFQSLGLIDLRGQANYTCEITDGTVADAPCHAGFECPVVSSCEYFKKLGRAPREQFVVSNPSFWLHNQHRLGEFDALIVDEGHKAFEELARFTCITFSKKEAKQYFDRMPTRDWKPWAGYQRSLTADELRALKTKPHKTHDDWTEINQCKRVLDRLEKLRDADPKTLIYQENLHGWTWDVVWPGAYRKVLTNHAKKFVFVSGTMTRRTFQMLGYTREDYTWGEFPSTFPVKRCPVYILPAPALNYQSTDSMLRLHLEVMDRFMDEWTHHRGLIHSGSYARAEYIALNSRHKGRMVTHNNSKGLPEAKERFLASKAGILVSPAIVEGEDFAYDKATWQLLAKLPFVNPNDPIEAERTRQDIQYPWYTAAQKVQQARGRVMRAEDDFGVTAIADGAWDNWFFKRSKHHFTSYFCDALIPVLRTPPAAVPKPATTTNPPSEKKKEVVKKTLDVKPAPASSSPPRRPLFTAEPSTKPNRRT